MICWEMYGSGVGISMEITQMELLSTLQDRMMVTTVFYVVAAGSMMPGTCGLLSVSGAGPTTAATSLVSALPEVMKGKAGRGVAELRGTNCRRRRSLRHEVDCAEPGGGGSKLYYSHSHIRLQLDFFTKNIKI